MNTNERFLKRKKPVHSENSKIDPETTLNLDSDFVLDESKSDLRSSRADKHCQRHNGPEG